MIIMDMQSKYLKLKKTIFEKIGKNYDLQAVKQYFKQHIDSNRTLSRIQSLSELIEILEERDILNYQCPHPLLYLAKDILKNEEVVDDVMIYKDMILDDADTYCTCGIKYHKYLKNNNVPFIPLLSEGISCSSKELKYGTDLQTIIKIVADNIGNYNWRVLASELSVVSEKEIDICYLKYPDEPKKQAYQMLQFWIKNDKENATVERLDKALNSRLCKRVNFGTHLRMPLAGRQY